MTLQEFDVLLAAHDWTYAYADDYRYFTRGQQERGIILDHVRNQPEFEPLFVIWSKFCAGSITKETFFATRSELLS